MTTNELRLEDILETQIFYSVMFCIEEKDLDTVRELAHSYLIPITHISREPDDALRLYTGQVRVGVWFDFRDKLTEKGVEIF